MEETEKWGANSLSRELRAAVLAKQKAEADLRDLYREREIKERGPPSVTRRPC